MDGDQKTKRRDSAIVAVTFTVFAGYLAFGMPPAPGGPNQIVGGAAMTLVMWSWCAFTWWQTSSIKHPHSTDVVELVMELEDKLKITVPDEDYEKIKTIDDATKYFEKRQKERN